MKALIITYNRLELPLKMANWLSERGVEPIFIDNNSDYPPLIQYYNDTPFQVHKAGGNYGHLVLWHYPLLQKLGIKENFIYTDPDLDLSGVPDDFLQVLEEGLERYPQFSKCALSLDIDDLPDDPEGNFIRNFEGKYWQYPLDDRYFYADTDTTFALYRYPIGEYGHSATRTQKPYCAKHLPWYYRDYSILSEDEQYYYKTAHTGFSSGIKRTRK